MKIRFSLTASALALFANQATAEGASLAEILAYEDPSPSLDVYDGVFLDEFASEYPIGCGPIAADGTCPFLTLRDSSTMSEATFFGLDLDGGSFLMARRNSQLDSDESPGCTIQLGGDGGLEVRIVAQLSLAGWQAGVQAPVQAKNVMANFSEQIFGADPLSCSAAVPRGSLQDGTQIVDIISVKDGRPVGDAISVAFYAEDEVSSIELKSLSVWIDEQSAEIEARPDPASPAEANASPERKDLADGTQILAPQDHGSGNTTGAAPAIPSSASPQLSLGDLPVFGSEIQGYWKDDGHLLPDANNRTFVKLTPETGLLSFHALEDWNPSYFDRFEQYENKSGRASIRCDYVFRHNGVTSLKAILVKGDGCESTASISFEERSDHLLAVSFSDSLTEATVLLESVKVPVRKDAVSVLPEEVSLLGVRPGMLKPEVERVLSQQGWFVAETESYKKTLWTTRKDTFRRAKGREGLADKIVITYSDTLKSNQDEDPIAYVIERSSFYANPLPDGQFRERLKERFGDDKNAIFDENGNLLKDPKCHVWEKNAFRCASFVQIDLDKATGVNTTVPMISGLNMKLGHVDLRTAVLWRRESASLTADHLRALEEASEFDERAPDF